MDLLEAERLRRLADIEHRGVFSRDGYLSVTAWLANVHRQGWGRSRASVQTARALEQMPHTTRALGSGDISMAAARTLVEAREVDAEAFPRAEEQLVEAARIHPIDELRKVTAYWRQRAESEQASAGREAQREGRGLHASVTLGGMVRVDGDLDPETGDTFLTALNAMQDTGAKARSEEDARSPAQRRADALGEICRQWLNREDRPSVAGERPHLSVTMDLDELRRLREGVAELEHTGPIGGSSALRLACDASIARVVLSGRSEPLDVGRRTPIVPAAMRRAVVARDRHCRFPGCDRPPGWADAHHVRHWADGGTTAVENLLLLCRRHHLAIHDHDFELAIEDGRAVFRRPDGSVLDDRASPWLGPGG